MSDKSLKTGELVEFLESLSDRELSALKHRLGDEFDRMTTLEELGSKFNVDAEKIRYLREKAEQMLCDSIYE